MLCSFSLVLVLVGDCGHDRRHGIDRGIAMVLLQLK